MFSILVSANSSAWELGKRMEMPRERFNEYSGDEAERLDLNEPETLRVLENTPAILMYEDCVGATPGDVVRIGHIKNISVHRRTVQFDFTEAGRIGAATVSENRHLLRMHDWEFSRTHWAIKNGNIPEQVWATLEETPREYDIVLSFAGENRDYVEAVAEFLNSNDVEVFYDKYEQTTLWGKDLGDHLDDVYRIRGRYCVMFVSRHYAEKMWTSHERKSAFARAIEQKGEYVLPVRFDDSEIPGLRPTVGYIDIQDIRPEALGELILKKLGRRA